MLKRETPRQREMWDAEPEKKERNTQEGGEQKTEEAAGRPVQVGEKVPARNVTMERWSQ